MSTVATKSEKSVAHEVCIDLPGESVQCWRSGDHLKVVLRKHRDVIFDLHLKAGAVYTVQAAESDFYNARDKRLMYASRSEVVTFKDGERLHLWVTRNFKGALLLKSEGKLLMKVEPNKLDAHQYDNNPKTKPAPIILSLGQANIPAKKPAVIPGITPVPSGATKPLLARTPGIPPQNHIAASAPDTEGCSVVCVVDGSIKGMPEKIADYFKKGGGKSGLADFDPSEVATRNWIWGQVAGSAAFVADNWSWLRASMDSKTGEGFKLVRAQLHLVRGKVRFYFSGYSKFNRVFGPGGFGPGHERILSIFAGVGKTSSSFAAVAKGVAGSFKGNALVSFIFGSVTAIAEWKDDVKKDGYDLTAALFMSLLKAIIAAAIVVAIVALVIFVAMVGLGAALPVLAVGALTVAAGIAVNYAVEAVDKALGRAATGDKSNTDGLSSAIAPYLRKAGKEIQAGWEYLMKKFPNDYRELLF